MIFCIIYYNFVLLVAAALIDELPLSSDISISANHCLLHDILAFVTMLYVFSGFIADVYCGWLKVVVTGLCFVLVFAILMWLVEIVAFVTFTGQVGTYKLSMIIQRRSIALLQILIIAEWNNRKNKIIRNVTIHYYVEKLQLMPIGGSWMVRSLMSSQSPIAKINN